MIKSDNTLTNELDYQEILRTLTQLSTANLCDAMQGFGALNGIHSTSPRVKIVGQALTVSAQSGDWAHVTEAIDQAKPGAVLVVDAGGTGPAVWGELAAHSAVQRRLAGVVVNGAVRDVFEIEQLGFPVFCRMVMPNVVWPKRTGNIGQPICISGVNIHPGDWIVGDSSGVVCISQNKIHEILPRALKIFEREHVIRDKIEKGSTLWKELALYWRDELLQR